MAKTAYMVPNYEIRPGARRPPGNGPRKPKLGGMQGARATPTTTANAKRSGSLKLAVMC